jgi:broad specificity phosphatase PhoE
MLLSLLFQLAVGAPPPPTIIIVRHAEKASETERDPALSAAGIARAAALDSVLADAKVTTIIVTPFRRTAETAMPVALTHRVTPMLVPVTGEVAAHAAQVAELAKGQEGVVLVVGHSNTVGAIVAALGGPRVGNLCDANYDQLFIVTFVADGARLVRSRYGREDPPEARVCG